jgi:predicted MFS family arabinose efflux permease
MDASISTPAATARTARDDFKVAALVSSAHMTSHFYMMLLPPLMPLIKTDLGVSYEAIGYVITVYNLITIATQTPLGFLVDRLGARVLLIAGLALGGLSLIVAGMGQSYWVLMGAFAFLGLANSVYHPADYSILSSTIAPERMGRAYGAHNFLGYIGFAMGPPIMLGAAALWGWHGALTCAGMIGLAIGLLILWQADALRGDREAAHGSESVGGAVSGARLLTSPPVLLALLFYICVSVGSTGISGFSVVALQALYGTPLEFGNAALSGFLAAAAIGVAAGGVLADWTRHHDRIAALGLSSTCLMVLVVGNVDLGNVLVVMVMTLAGFMHGAINPSRDMLVRSITPPGQAGKVFGFVTTGFSIGGMIMPPILGHVIDQGDPRWIFWISAVALVLAIFARPRRRAVGGQ